MEDVIVPSLAWVAAYLRNLLHLLLGISFLRVYNM